MDNFNTWLLMREGNQLDATGEWQPSPTSTKLSGYDHLVQMLKDFMNEHYASIGGWTGVENLAKTNLNFSVLIKKSLNQLRNWLPGNDSIDTETEMHHTITELGDKIGQRMISMKPTGQAPNKGTGQYNNNQQPVTGQQMPQEALQRIKSLEDKVAQLEKLINNLRGAA